MSGSNLVEQALVAAADAYQKFLNDNHGAVTETQNLLQNNQRPHMIRVLHGVHGNLLVRVQPADDTSV